MTQKIIQVGNSLAVTIPSDFAREAKLKAGQKIRVDEDYESKTLTVQPVDAETKSGNITPEFLNWLKKFNSKHKDVLKELSKK